MSDAYPVLTGETGTVNTGTNVVTLDDTTAVRDLRLFSAAVTAGSLADGQTVRVLVKESATKQAVWIATYDSTAKTLTRTSLIDAIGTLTNVAAVDVTGKPLDPTQQLALSHDAANYIGLPMDEQPLKWDGATTGVSLAGPGAAMVNGELLEWSSDIAVSYTPSTSGWKHVYLYDNSGTPALEVNDTDVVAVWDSDLGYWKKGGGTPDASRRRVGVIYVWDDTGTDKILEFESNLISERTVELVFVDNETVIEFLFVNSSSTLATDFTTGHPTDVVQWCMDVRLSHTADGDDVGVGVHTTDFGSLDNWARPYYHVRASAGVAGSKTFFGRFWFPSTNDEAFRLSNLSGSGGNVEIYSHGVRFLL